VHKKVKSSEPHGYIGRCGTDLHFL